MRPAILTIVSLATLSACAASAAPPPAEFLAAVLLPDRRAVQASPSALAAAPLRNAAAPAGKSSRRQRARPGGSPLAQVEAANGAAVREPAAAGYVGAVQVYPWAEGALYRLYTAPGEVSDIALQPGESLVSVAAGDTVRWVIGDTASGSGAARRTHILVKPSAAGLRTNLVIATDRRVYHVEAESHAETAMASIAWTYPDDALLALRGTAGAPVAAGVAVDSLNFDYRIEGDNPPWRPVRAFDDGRQVFIEFPPAFGQGEAPPLFVVGDKGRAELVNYRIRGRYYVVDRLFAAAELRLGERRQQIVRIVRDRRRAK
ncbi:MAG TPA: P-type conjugative transfer protein TrbG [Sphingomicrobium sp.]|nr:P-type conjugative transfer protein TrbG [Sphingomicrobium sp.]